VSLNLPISGAGAVPRLISQPVHGTVGVQGTVATYFPDLGFVGTDVFTFAAWDRSKNSTLATGTVAVAQGPFSVVAEAHVPPSYPASWPVPFAVVANPSNVVSVVTVDWDFGDGSAHGTGAFPTHTYAAPGVYQWTAVAQVGVSDSVATATTHGEIVVDAPLRVSSSVNASHVTVSWPVTSAATLLEETPELGPAPAWNTVPDAVATDAGTLSVSCPLSAGNTFFRVRPSW
jgi:hypothetical protein